MYVLVAGFSSPAWIVVALSALLCLACGDEPREEVISVGEARDASMPSADEDSMELARRCDLVEIDGNAIIEHEKDFTAHYRAGEPYRRTVMLFGGEAVEDDNVLSTGYIFALDKMDAIMLAQKYPDFYLCSSPGGKEASDFIVPYDLVPASCEVHDQIVAALRLYNRNVASGGDRTSLLLEGAPLELESVIEDATGVEVTDQVSGQDFHLVTAVERLTGQSVVSFGMSE